MQGQQNIKKIEGLYLICTLLCHLLTSAVGWTVWLLRLVGSSRAEIWEPRPDIMTEFLVDFLSPCR